MSRTSLVSKYNVDGLLDSLTDMRKAFVLHFIETDNGAEAVRRAGYKSSHPAVMAAKILKDERVAAVVGELKRRMLEESFVTAEDAMQQLGYLLTRDALDFVDPETGYLTMDVHKLPPRARAAIDAIEQEVVGYEEDGTPRIKTKLKISPKATAVDMALKVFGSYAPKQIQQAVLTMDWNKIAEDSRKPDPVETKLLEVEDGESNEPSAPSD